MDPEGPGCQPKRGASRITAVIAIEGPEARVLEDGRRLLRTIVDDLDRAALLNQRLEYDQSAPRRVAAPGTDVVDLVAPGSDSPAEADLWRLALRAGARVNGKEGRRTLLPSGWAEGAPRRSGTWHCTPPNSS